jgi:hypothetical protein
MLYVRGNKRDYDGWEKAGNYGWSYKDVLPYFIKSEDNRNPYLAKNKDYHGTGGLLTVQEAPYSTPLSTAFIQAGVELGNSFFFSLFIPSFLFLYTFEQLEMKCVREGSNHNRFLTGNGNNPCLPSVYLFLPKFD